MGQRMAILVKSDTPSEEKDRWGTQWECFYDAQVVTGVTALLDVAAESQTAKCGNFISPQEDSLKVDWLERFSSIAYIKRPTLEEVHIAWRQYGAWCNPPFTMKTFFLERAHKFAQLGLTTICLVPYERTTNWWKHCVKGKADTVFVPDGRYNFLKVDGRTKKTGVNFPSCFVRYSPGHFEATQYVDFARGIHKL